MGELVPQAPKPERLKAFRESHDPAEVSKLMEELGLSLRAEMELLQEAMSKKQPMKTRMKAQQQLRGLLRDIRMASTILMTMTKREDGTVEQTTVAPALLQDLREGRIDGSHKADKEGTHSYLPPATGRGSQPSDEDGFNQGALERALRRSITPKPPPVLDVEFTVVSPGPEGGGLSDVQAESDGHTDAGDDGAADSAPPGNPGTPTRHPGLAGVWPPPEK